MEEKDTWLIVQDNVRLGVFGELANVTYKEALDKTPKGFLTVRKVIYVKIMMQRCLREEMEKKYK